MIKDVFESIGAAARKLFANWGAILISLLLYAALIGALYLFFTIREATTPQVVLNLILPIAAVALFFLIQAIGLSYVRIGVGAGYLLKRGLKDCWKLFVISLPLILIGGLIFWKLGFVFSNFDPKWSVIDAKLHPSPYGWPLQVIVDTVWLLFFYIVLPLITIHLWINATREGLGGAFKGFGRSVARALAPRSLLIYALVCAVFSAIIYFLLFKKVAFKGEWTELWAVGIKTTLALLMVFIGWLLTLGSMAEMTARRAMKGL